MAKYRCIGRDEVVVKANKREALEYFKEKDKDITLFHVKNVVMLDFEDIEHPAGHIENVNEELSYTNKTKSNGKAKQDAKES